MGAPSPTHAGFVARVAAALDGPAAAPPVELVGACGGYAAVALAQLERDLDRPLVIVVPDVKRAAVLEDGLGFFAGGADPRQGELPLDPVAQLPPLEHVPYQGMSPSRLQVMERVTSLFRVVHDPGLRALVVPATALVDRYLPRAALRAHAYTVIAGEAVDREGLIHFLAATGYHRIPTVDAPGTFAVRGGIIDVYSPLGDTPARIELWDDEVDSIKLFDAVTQRTGKTVSRLTIGPARDIVFTHAAITGAKRRIRDLADDLEIPTSRVRALTDDLDSGVLAVGMEELLPLFHDGLDTLFDLAWPGALWVVEEPARCARAIRERWEDLSGRAARRLAQGGELCLPAEALFVPADAAIDALAAHARAHLVPLEVTTASRGGDAIRFEIERHEDLRREIEAAMRGGDERVLSPLVSRVHRWREAGLTVVACGRGPGGVKRLSGLLRHYGIALAVHDRPFSLDQLDALGASGAHLHLFDGTPGQGFVSNSLGLVLLDETEILGKPPRRRRRRHQAPPEQALQSWRDLERDDFVVHLQHGIGRYLGLENIVVDGIETDFLVLEYAGGDKLFVPVDKLHLVSKHSSADGSAAPKVDKLGAARWQRTTKRVKRAVRNIAHKLLKLYARRAARRGFAFSPPDEDYHRFEASFPYQETPDQARAIDETLEDMQRERPMDRLVCGDVGFGKTEVALRAAFKAVLDGRQVAVLVPTRVLAEQHRLTFARRLEGFAVQVDSLTRDKSATAQKDVLRRLAHGSLDVAIGTHRLLSKDVEFKALGLVVVDEEHRFGVAHKERLKELRATVDVLTLTATPIPRTLHMAMTGMRDITLIRTPPTDRLPIRTLVAQPNEHVIRDAIERELARGGQVFFVHHLISDIARQAELIRRLVPAARIAIGHGRMERGQLDQVMLKFVRGEANVLVSTTVIESGIDIPTANTMLINRADRFGLAQLYQLRGRVGRSSVRAYCYLLVPSPQTLAGNARERIAAIQRFTELGSGLSVASHDLDIRGAGDLLGADQAGNIDAVGYEAYMELLRQAIEEARAEREGEPAAAAVDPELKTAVEGRIPESWLPDTPLRLRLYRELAGAPDVPSLFDVYRAAVDRYGHAPQPVDNLVELMAIRLEGRALGLKAIAFNPSTLSFALTEQGPLGPDDIARLTASTANGFRLTPDLRLVRAISPEQWQRGLEVVRESLRWLRDFAT